MSVNEPVFLFLLNAQTNPLLAGEAIIGSQPVVEPGSIIYNSSPLSNNRFILSSAIPLMIFPSKKLTPE